MFPCLKHQWKKMKGNRNNTIGNSDYWCYMSENSVSVCVYMYRYVMCVCECVVRCCARMWYIVLQRERLVSEGIMRRSVLPLIPRVQWNMCLLLLLLHTPPNHRTMWKRTVQEGTWLGGWRGAWTLGIHLYEVRASISQRSHINPHLPGTRAN